MFQQHFLKRIGMCFLVVTSLCSVDVHKVKAQSTSVEDDAKRLVEIGEWVSHAWGYIQGTETAIEFLTGVGQKKELTLEDIKGTIDDALIDQDDRHLVDDVRAYAKNLHDFARDVNVGMSTQELFDMLRLTFFKQLIEERSEGTKLFTALNSILHLPSNVRNDQRVIAVMPAYIVFVPLFVSTTRLINEVEPGLRLSQDMKISETLAEAQQALFTAAGSYTLYAYEPGAGGNPNFLYSQVAIETSGWMTKWPLYAFYFLDPFLDKQFSGPLEPFQIYQTIPIVKLALDSLESIVKAQPSIVWARDALIFNLFSDKRAPFVFGWIVQVRPSSTPIFPSLELTGSATFTADGKCNGNCFVGASTSSTGDLIAFFWLGDESQTRSTQGYNFNVVNVSATTGYRNITGPVTSWQTPDGPFTVEHLAVAGSSGDLLIFFAESPDDWHVVNVSGITKQQIAGPVTSWQRLESIAVPPGEPGGGTSNVEYLAGVSPGGDLLVFSWSPRADWHVVNVTEQTQQKVARTDLGPFVSRLTSWQTRGLQSLAAVSPRGNLLIFSESPADFRHWDLVNVSRQTGRGHQITGPVVRWVTRRRGFLVEQLAGASPSGDLLVFSPSSLTQQLVAGGGWQVVNVPAIIPELPIIVPLTITQPGSYEQLTALGPPSNFLVFYRVGFSTRTDPVGWGVCSMSTSPPRVCTNELH